MDDLFAHLKLDQAIVIAHSLGASIVYNYIDLFGTGKISKLVIVDEPPCLLINPIWTEEERKNYGAIYEASTLHQITNDFLSDNPSRTNNKIIDMMTTKSVSKVQKEFLISCMSIDGEAATQLYFNNICQDFRDVIKKINIPTLVITGKGSLHPWQSHQWMHEQIPNSRLEIFPKEQGGNHFPFVENPEKFNKTIYSFLDK